MTFDYEAYVADFLTGDDDALVARWFAEDCAIGSIGSRCTRNRWL